MNLIQEYLKEFTHDHDGDNHDEAVRHVKMHAEGGEVRHGNTGISIHDVPSHLSKKKEGDKKHHEKNFDAHHGEEKTSEAVLDHKHVESGKFHNHMLKHGWSHKYHEANDIHHYDKGTTKVVHEQVDDYVSIHTHPTMAHKEHHWGKD